MSSRLAGVEVPCHMRGPWTVEEVLDVRTFDAECTSVRLVHGGRQGDVAYAAHGPERDANARLIAAAPDLLALCQEMEAWLRPELVKEPERTYFWKLVAVIAKATVPQSDEPVTGDQS